MKFNKFFGRLLTTMLVSIGVGFVHAQGPLIDGKWEGDDHAIFTVAKGVKRIEFGDLGTGEMEILNIPDTVEFVSSFAINNDESNLRCLNLAAKVVMPFAFQFSKECPEVRVMKSVEILPHSIENNSYAPNMKKNNDDIHNLSKICVKNNPVFFVEKGNEKYSSDEYGVLYSKDKSILISVPTYLCGKFVVPKEVKVISPGCFEGTSLSEIIVKDNVIGMDDSVFEGLFNFKSSRKYTASESLESVFVPSHIMKHISPELANMVEFLPTVLADKGDSELYLRDADLRGMGISTLLMGGIQAEIYNKSTRSDYCQISVNDFSEYISESSPINIMPAETDCASISWESIKRAERSAKILKSLISGEELDNIKHDYISFSLIGLKNIPRIDRRVACPKVFDRLTIELRGIEEFSPEGLRKVRSLTKCLFPLERVTVFFSYDEQDMFKGISDDKSFIKAKDIPKYLNCDKICFIGCSKLGEISGLVLLYDFSKPFSNSEVLKMDLNSFLKDVVKKISLSFEQEVCDVEELSILNPHLEVSEYLKLVIDQKNLSGFDYSE